MQRADVICRMSRSQEAPSERLLSDLTSKECAANVNADIMRERIERAQRAPAQESGVRRRAARLHQQWSAAGPASTCICLRRPCA